MEKNIVFQAKQLVFSLRGAFVLILLACSNFLVIGQQTTQLETEQGLTNAVASYNTDVRQAALVASQNPQILTQLQNRQNQTVSNFQNMISDFRQAKQAWFYTLTRYPNLIHTLATLPDGNDKEDVYKLLPNQDENLQKAAWKLYNNDKQDLVEIDNMQMAAQQDFDKSIQGLDQPTKEAFQKLATMPDVLSILTNNIDLTSKLGQKFKDNPTQVTTDLATLHDNVVLKNETEMANFRKQLAENPQAQQEFNQAVKDYANANGYNPQNQYNNNQNYYSNPYSYWFGYPSWYGSPMWYPGAYGYNMGFGVGFGGRMFGYGLPYYGFSNWFINTGYHYRYPTLYRQFGGYFNHNNYGGNRGMSYNNGMMNNRMGYGNTQLNRVSGQSYQNNVNRSSGNNSYGGSRFGGGGNFGGGGGFHGGGGGRGGGRH